MKRITLTALLATLALGLAGCRDEPSSTDNRPTNPGPGNTQLSADDSSATTAEDIFQDLSLDAALKSAGEQSKLVMVDFYADWCPPCKMLDSTTWRHKEVVAWLREHTVPIKIDTDKNGQLAAQHRIEGLPTMVFLRPDGTETGRLVGYLPPKQFLEAAPKAIR